MSAQVPQAINYQTVVRNASGSVISNQEVKLGFILHDGSPTGAVVWDEIDTGRTNQFGLFTCALGRGTTQGYHTGWQLLRDKLVDGGVFSRSGLLH